MAAGLLLTLLAVAGLPLAALGLAVLEGVVAQTLLLAGHLVEFLGLLAHLAVARVGLAALLGALQVLEDAAQLFEQALGLRGVAALHRIGHVLDHLVEVVGRDALGILLLPAVALLLRLLALALGHLLHELVEGLFQVLGELLHLLVGSVALDRLLELVLGGAQGLLGVREVAVLDLEGHLPEEIGHLDQRLVGARGLQAARRRTQAEEDRKLRRKAIGRDHQGVERRLHAAPALVGRGHQAPPLLGKRPRQGLLEGPRRQRHLDGLATRALVGLVLDREGEAHPRARPWMIGKVDEGLGVGLAAGVGGQREGNARRRHQRAAGFQRFDHAFGGGDAVIVAGPVAEVERATTVHLRRPDAADHRSLVGDGLDDEALRRCARGLDGEIRDPAGELEAILAQVGPRILAGQRLKAGMSGELRLALAGDAHDQGRVDRRPKALVAAGESHHQGRHPGVERRIDPAVDPEARAGRGRRAPIEGAADALAPFGARDEEAGRRRHQDRRPQGEGIAPRHRRPRRGDLEPRHGRRRPSAMKRPQRLGLGIAGADGQRILDRRGGIVGQITGHAGTTGGIAVDPRQRLAPARAPHPRQGQEGRREGDGEKGEAGHAAARAEIEPETEPGDREEG